ncbi:hypothetical protein WN943_025026 [Citrus x changshan-huyou]
MNVFFDGFVNSKINLKQFVKQYENALRRKAELEWQADAKCFSKRTSCVSRYEMERQVKEVYTIFKFKEFQEELTALMYCDVLDSVGSIYKIIESFGQGQRGIFEDLQENVSSSYHVPNEISTQWSNIAMQPVPPYTSQLRYSSPLMTYQGSQGKNFQQLLQQQQRNKDNNHDA